MESFEGSLNAREMRLRCQGVLRQQLLAESQGGAAGSVVTMVHPGSGDLLLYA